MSLDNLTFRVGGLHINENKNITESLPIETMPDPDFVYIPMSQHIGAPATPIVEKGQKVKRGQKIGDSKAFISAPVHSSISGTVVSIEKMYTADGRYCDCIIIENDHLDDAVLDEPMLDYKDRSMEEIVNFVKEKGIVGMGGAGFPLHAKLVSKDPVLDQCIINGAECEAYLTCDHRIMLEDTDKILEGLNIFSEFYNKDVSYMAIENNKKDAIDLMRKRISQTEAWKHLKVVTLKTKYPQGDSKRLTEAVVNRIVPPNKVTNDVGVFLTNVGTTLAFYEAMIEGIASYQRVITVSGKGIKEPKNILVKVGTSVGDIIDFCGGLEDDYIDIVCGGPMTGKSVFEFKSPITKTTSGLLVLTKEEINYGEENPCIRCARCVEFCPANIRPTEINSAILKNDVDTCKDLYADQCMECGICSYICPAKRNLSASVKLAKREIRMNSMAIK